MAKIIKCEEILEWDEDGERPIKMCAHSADWENMEPRDDSINFICDSCAAKRFPKGMGRDWKRVSVGDLYRQSEMTL